MGKLGGGVAALTALLAQIGNATFSASAAAPRKINNGSPLSALIVCPSWLPWVSSPRRWMWFLMDQASQKP